MNNLSESLICHERPKRIAHGCSFVLSDLSDSLTVTHLIWAKWSNERWANERIPSPAKNKDGKQRSLLLFWETDLNQFLAALDIFHQDDMKKRMNRIKTCWRNGCFEKMDDHLVHTISNHHPTKMDVLPKSFVKNILAPKWLVRPQNISDNLSMFFLLSFFFFYMAVTVCYFTNEASLCM